MSVGVQYVGECWWGGAGRGGAGRGGAGLVKCVFWVSVSDKVCLNRIVCGDLLFCEGV